MDSNLNASIYQLVSTGDRYERLFLTSQDGILILNANDGKILDANPFIVQLTGFSKEELLDKYVWDIGFIKNILENKDNFLELQEKGYMRYENIPIEKKNGEIQYVEFISNTYSVGQSVVIQCNIRDITQRVRLEKINSELGMMYQVIFRCNQVLLHETTVDALITQMCKVLISAGGFLAAWFSTAPETSEDLINPIAAEGLYDGYFNQIKLDQGGDAIDSVSKAVYAAEFFVCQDFKKDANNSLDPELALKYKFKSAVVIPIQSLKLSPYILTVYAGSAQAFTDDIIELLSNLASDIAFGINILELQANNLKMADKVEKSLSDTVASIASMVEHRDLYTAGHQHRVADLSVAIATEMGLSHEVITGLRMAAVVHDIGKILIPVEILSKPAHLTGAEYEIVKTHPKAGWEVLKNIDFPWPVAEIVYQHHERLDGSGYPRGLKASEILIEAKIIMVADVLDAMSTHRPYRASLGIMEALQEIMQHKGTLYDEKVVDTCLQLFIQKKYKIQ